MKSNNCTTHSNSSNAFNIFTEYTGVYNDRQILSEYTPTL
jgi:hypothetical protein